MFTLIRRAPQSAKIDPAPSRWAWRMQRLMLTPMFRFGLRVGVPFCAALLIGTVYLSNDARRASIGQVFTDLRQSIEQRPEFMVKLMAIDGADGAVDAAIRAAVPIDFPKSSFDLDLEEIRAKVAALDSVKSANIRIRPGGVLQLDVLPRIPVAVWRDADGLSLVDEGGVHVADVASRAEFPHLPLIAGEKAARHVPEALALIRSSHALGPRLRGLVRIGDRRWDVVLDRDQRILLPETDAVHALERVIALEGAQDVLTRDVARVDMRLSARPTIRMNEQATQKWWDIKQASGR